MPFPSFLRNTTNTQSSEGLGLGLGLGMGLGLGLGAAYISFTLLFSSYMLLLEINELSGYCFLVFFLNVIILFLFLFSLFSFILFYLLLFIIWFYVFVKHIHTSTLFALNIIVTLNSVLFIRFIYCLRYEADIKNVSFLPLKTFDAMHPSSIVM